MTVNDSQDVLFVGAGLANTLAAWRLTALRPEIKWRMLEASSKIGGGTQERTWSFHEADLNQWRRFGHAGDGFWLLPLSSHRWQGYDVIFPNLQRSLDGLYCSIKSNDLDRAAKAVFGERVTFDVPVRDVRPTGVTLDDGRTVEARMVIDGRGFGGSVPYACGYQKFIGLNVKLTKPHGLTRPTLMDARVAQTDGFRFIYTLPWSDTDLLVEDTYYSDTPTLDEANVIEGIEGYFKDRFGEGVVMSQEKGTLPIPLAGAQLPRLNAGIASSGVAAGRYHPTTGYSVPEAARFAASVAELDRFDPPTADRLNTESMSIWQRGDFLRRLNNMMFRAGAPDQRWRIMETFYRRSPELIHRFYRGDLTASDRLRLLTGKPPVPVAPALAAFVGRFHAQRSPLA